MISTKWRPVLACAVTVSRWSQTDERYVTPEPCGRIAVAVVNDRGTEVPCCAHHKAMLATRLRERGDRR